MSRDNPTTRTIAAEAGVCCATVSLALRNHASIPAATRTRIQRIAQKQGYQPDPFASRLMAHIRTHPTMRTRASICALSDFAESSSSPYVDVIDRAAHRQAQALGFFYRRMHLSDFHESKARLSRGLAAQGIDGILLLPMRELRIFDNLLDWQRYSVISTSYSVVSPHFHRVVPDQFANLKMTCEMLVKRGYHRIGFITSRDDDVRAHHHFTAAIAWHNTFGGAEAITPLVHRPENIERSWIAWLKQKKPDVVIVWDSARFLHLARKIKLHIPNDIAVVAFSPNREAMAAIDERPTATGATAVDLLAGMIQRGEKGVPAMGNVTMVPGTWNEGWSVRGG